MTWNNIILLLLIILLSWSNEWKYFDSNSSGDVNVGPVFSSAFRLHSSNYNLMCHYSKPFERSWMVSSSSVPSAITMIATNSRYINNLVRYKLPKLLYNSMLRITIEDSLRPNRLERRQNSYSSRNFFTLSMTSTSSEQNPQIPDVEVSEPLPPSYLQVPTWDPAAEAARIASIPVPLNQLVDASSDRRTVAYEVELNRDLGIGFDIEDGKDFPVVGKVYQGSKAESLGVLEGDSIVATSATAGDQMWSHESAESVRSALNTRFVMSASVKMRLERSVDSIDPAIMDQLKVPFYTTVRLKRPIGLHVIEGSDHGVYVRYMKPQMGAAKSRRVEVGDQIVSMSASWGDRMWDVHSIESFVVGVRMRSGAGITVGLKRRVSLREFTGDVSSRRSFVLTEQRQKLNNRDHHILRAASTSSIDGKSETINTERGTQRKVSKDEGGNQSPPATNPVKSLPKAIAKAHSADSVKNVWHYIRDTVLLEDPEELGGFNTVLANKLMGRALKAELPHVAIEIFETLFGFCFKDSNPADTMKKLLKPSTEEELQQQDGKSWTWNALNRRSSTDLSKLKPPGVAEFFDEDIQSIDEDEETKIDGAGEVHSAPNNRFSYLVPNNYVCTTAVKAYGRTRQTVKALAVRNFLENGHPDVADQSRTADAYLLSAILYVCAKSKRIKEAESIFWHEFPARKLEYTVVTANSLMYMYARLNRPTDALRVYDIIKERGMNCTVVTYGVLIKALMGSNQRALQETAFDILKSLPELGINPGVEVYNQILDSCARSHNFRKAKEVLRLMSSAKPKVKLDGVSYTHLIRCFADSKKPRSALSTFSKMRDEGFAPTASTYMGVLKALAHMRDGLSPIEVLREMYDVGIAPDRRHYAQAMFACIKANQCGVAESVIALFKRKRGDPDVVLCTLWMRALLQQNKWKEANELLKRMEIGCTKKGRRIPHPNHETYNYLLQFQIKEEKWNDASESLLRILNNYAEASTKFKFDKTFESLSYALGMYSGEVTRRYREDQSSSLHFSMDTLDAIADNVQIASSTDVTLSKPSVPGLEFIMQSMRIFCDYPHVKVPADLYVELLKSLVLEGQASLAMELLEMHGTGRLQLRDEDVLEQQVEEIEGLTSRAIKGGLIVPKKEEQQ